MLYFVRYLLSGWKFDTRPGPLLTVLRYFRMPYFSYLSMLFFYETLGWWSGGAEVRKVHFAEVCERGRENGKRLV